MPRSQLPPPCAFKALPSWSYWQLDEKLKGMLSEPLRLDYASILAAARARLSEEFVVGEILQD